MYKRSVGSTPHDHPWLSLTESRHHYRHTPLRAAGTAQHAKNETISMREKNSPCGLICRLDLNQGVHGCMAISMNYEMCFLSIRNCILPCTMYYELLYGMVGFYGF